MPETLNINGRDVIVPTDHKDYWRKRHDHDLYRLTLALAQSFFPHAESVIDVGCHTSGLICEMDWIERRVASDLQKYLMPYWEGVPGVEFLASDAFKLAETETFDLVLSNQTIEHVEDPAGFVQKLLALGRGLIISTTYETPAGMIHGHIQDPISLEKFQSWFPCPIDAWTICHHPSRKIQHIVAVIAQSHPTHATNEMRAILASTYPPGPFDAAEREADIERRLAYHREAGTSLATLKAWAANLPKAS